MAFNGLLLGCKCLEVVKLSGVKMSDSGLGLLLYYSLCSLRELDLSHTDITDKALEHMPKGRILDYVVEFD